MKSKVGDGRYPAIFADGCGRGRLMRTVCGWNFAQSTHAADAAAVAADTRESSAVRTCSIPRRCSGGVSNQGSVVTLINCVPRGSVIRASRAGLRPAGSRLTDDNAPGDGAAPAGTVSHRRRLPTARRVTNADGRRYRCYVVRRSRGDE